MNTQSDLIGTPEGAFFTVEKYTSKSKPSSEAQRLSVVIFKTPKAEKNNPQYKKPDALCVSIPTLRVHTTPSVVEAALQSAFEDLQDKVVRDLIEEKMAEGKSIINLHETTINFDAIAKWALENAASGKMTKEQIYDWFDESLADAMTIRVADAMKLPSEMNQQQAKQLADAVSTYRTAFGQFSAPKAGLSKKIAGQLQKALALLDDEQKEHRVAKSLAEKLAVVLAAKDIELNDLL